MCVTLTSTAVTYKQPLSNITEVTLIRRRQQQEALVNNVAFYSLFLFLFVAGAPVSATVARAITPTLT